MFVIINQIVMYADKSRSASLPAGQGRNIAATQIKFGEIVQHIRVTLILFVDLQDAPVLMIGGRKNARRLTGQEEGGEAAVTVDHAADDQHGHSLNPMAIFANPGCP